MVEFAPEAPTQPNADRIEKAVTAYIEIIESADAGPVDIVVFPESTLNNRNYPLLIPEPADRVTPCGNDSYDAVLQRLSCSASRSRKYVVINVTEKKNASDADSPDVTLHYNANVVFDRNGVVISRYRKFNLFGEAGINITDTADISWFETDFNVTFGHFICFDLMFKEPAMVLLKNADIHDIVYPTMWFSELPFLTAVQAQGMWATKNRVNFLAAGANYPRVGSTGSGIYSKDGPLTAIMSPVEQRKLLVAEVLKRQYWDSDTRDYVPPVPEYTQSELLNLTLKRDHLDVYSSQIINLNEAINKRLCYGKLCCSFQITATRLDVSPNAKSYKYRMFVFDGVRTYDGFASGGTFACALVSCTSDELGTCGQRFDKADLVEPDFLVESLEITGNFRSNENILSMPNTNSLEGLYPIPQSEYVYEESSDFSENG